jgi:hypothetical protein
MAFKQSEVVEFAKNNLPRIIEQMNNIAKGRFLGGIVEILAAEIMGSQYCDEEGHDYIHPIYGRVEVKSTTDIQNGTNLRVNSLKSKKDKCDFVHVIDMNSDRHFMVPHNVVFYELDLYKEDELRWSASYNKTDKVKVNNTNILLKYEVEVK